MHITVHDLYMYMVHVICMGEKEAVSQRRLYSSVLPGVLPSSSPVGEKPKKEEGRWLESLSLLTKAVKEEMQLPMKCWDFPKTTRSIWGVAGLG